MCCKKGQQTLLSWVLRHGKCCRQLCPLFSPELETAASSAQPCCCLPDREKGTEPEQCGQACPSCPQLLLAGGAGVLTFWLLNQALGAISEGAVQVSASSPICCRRWKCPVLLFISWPATSAVSGFVSCELSAGFVTGHCDLS